MYIVISVSMLLVSGCQRASRYLHETIMPKSEFIQNAEEGLYKFRLSRYEDSIVNFKNAIDLYRASENKPLVSLSDMLIFGYDGEGYDKVFLHNYNALNYMMLGKLEDAKIEVRNSNFIQNQMRKLFYDKVHNDTPLKEAYQITYDRYETLFKSVNVRHNPYQNPFAYYISALLYEEEGAFDDAVIDIKNALQYLPDSQLLQKKLQMYRYRHIPQKRVELFFDIGMSPLKIQKKLAVKVDKEHSEMIYLPDFKLTETDVAKVILTDHKNTTIVTSELLSDVDAIKINEFKKKLPFMIEKVAKEALMASVTNQKSSPTIGLAKTLYTLYSQNNLHTWKNLPKKIEVISFVPDMNKQYQLKLVDKKGNIIAQKKLYFKSSKNYKNIYQYYRIKEGKFDTISQER